MKRSHAAIWTGALFVSCGCASGPHTTAGAAFGTGLGAVTGAVIGSQSGDAASGAAIGAAAGALAGGLAGNAADARDERDAAFAQLHHERALHQAQALTNADLVMMTQSGVGDDVIINAVHTRGGRFDLSPAAIIQLKNSRVSDRVLLSIQSAQGATAPTFVPAAPAYVAQPVVVVPPRPALQFGVLVGSRPRWHGHRHPW